MSYKNSVAKHDIDTYLYLAQPVPEFSIRQKIEQIIKNSDAANVNVLKFGSDYVAVSDTWKMYSINRTNLNTIKPIYPGLSGRTSSQVKNSLTTSHPLPISGTDHWVSFSLETGFRTYVVNVFLIKSANERQLLTTIPVDKDYYMHSFGATENYAVFFVHPFYCNLATILEKIEVLDALRWNPEEPTYIYVVNLKTTEVRKFTTESRFLTHHINGFEVNEHNGKNGTLSLVMDFVTYNDSAAITQQTIDLLNDAEARRKFLKSKPEITRYILHLNNGTVSRKTFPNKPGMDIASNLDFPVINEKFRYRRYCNVYGVHPNGIEDMILLKKDLCNHEKDLMWSVPNHYPGEPWFVADPNGTAEDDGLVLDVVLDGNKERSYLAIFDAKTMKMINRAYLPNFIPFGLHGRLFD